MRTGSDASVRATRASVDHRETSAISTDLKLQVLVVYKMFCDA